MYSLEMFKLLMQLVGEKKGNLTQALSGTKTDSSLQKCLLMRQITPEYPLHVMSEDTLSKKRIYVEYCSHVGCFNYIANLQKINRVPI